VNVKIKFNHIEKDGIILKNNERKILQQLLDLGYKLPYSCKSGICGSCLCYLKNGEVDMTEDEYLTENEKRYGKILPCVSIAMSKDVYLDFDLYN
jgi:ring-1,2-phenylacetyl-CoA epoxidase subunit PaaE